MRAGILPAALILLVLAATAPPASAVQAGGAPGNSTGIAPGPLANGSVYPGPGDSLTGVKDWAAGLSDSLTAYYRDMLETFGLGGTDYTREMSRSLEKGLNLTRNLTPIP